MPASSPIETTAVLTDGILELQEAPARRGVVIGNLSDTQMNVRIGDLDADATNGIPVPPGTALALRDDFCPTDRITIFCAGASKAVTAYEWIL